MFQYYELVVYYFSLVLECFDFEDKRIKNVQEIQY